MVTAKWSSRRECTGFTLIEMLVVIVVMAILAAIVLPKFQDQSRRSKEAALKSDLSQLRSAIAIFQTDTGYYPAALSDLTAASAATVSGAYDTAGTAQTITAASFHGPYLTGTVPTDPVSASAFTYSVATPAVGQVTSSATGNDLNGTAYSTY